MPLINFETKHNAADRRQSDVLIAGSEGGDVVHSYKMAGLETLMQEMKNNLCVHFVSDGNWSLYDYLIAALEDHMGACDVWLTTYSMTELSARILAKMKDSGKIANLYVLMDYKSKMRYPQVDQLVRNVATRMGLVHIHAKVLIIGNGSVYRTLIGSANWTKNPRLEVGVIDSSDHVARQHIQWIEKSITNGADS